ncbi:hypothetical protein QA601_00790 [Chitinispirillales bacterium ANBcel5]|uniref:hypothetical protein n=1 Tax=Cellulosispirillum alkaliphilum TaxID=3039283 RepID=UPI002A55F123|nr:hypothetical protein [Chitinispirillales bacterium ANBcel5]
MRRNDAPGRIKKEKRVEEQRKRAIPFLRGRPERETAIGADDITNLVIALYASKSLEEFLRKT